MVRNNRNKHLDILLRRYNKGCVILTLVARLHHCCPHESGRQRREQSSSQPVLECELAVRSEYDSEHRKRYLCHIISNIADISTILDVRVSHSDLARRLCKHKSRSWCRSRSGSRSGGAGSTCTRCSTMDVCSGTKRP